MQTHMNEAGQCVRLPNNPDDWCGDRGDCLMTDQELGHTAGGLPTARWGPANAHPPVDAMPVRVLYEVVIQGRMYVECHQYIHMDQLTLDADGAVVFRGQPVLRLKSQPDCSCADVYGTKPNRWTGD